MCMSKKVHNLNFVSIHSRRNTFEVHKRWCFKWCAYDNDFESSGLCVCVVLVVLDIWNTVHTSPSLSILTVVIC